MPTSDLTPRSPLTARLNAHLRQHLVGYLAIVLALVLASGAPAWAARTIGAGDIKRDAIRSQHIKNNAVTGKDVKKRSLTGAHLKNGSLTGAQVRKGNLTGAQVAPDSLTGVQIDESTLRLGRVFAFDDQTFTGSINFDIEVPRRIVDSSSIHVLYSFGAADTAFWYPAPGPGPDFLFLTRWFLGPVFGTPSTYRLSLRTVNNNGSPYGFPVTFRQVKVIFIPHA